MPALNQVEIHPSFQQADLRDAHRRLGICTQAWSPLGNGKDLADPRLAAIGDRLGASAAQIILAWLAEQGILPVVKSSSTEHMRENLAALDIELSPEDLELLSQLDRNESCFGVDPRTFVAPQGFGDFRP